MIKTVNAFVLCLMMGLALGACKKQQQPQPLVYGNWHHSTKVLKEKGGRPYYYVINARYPEISGTQSTSLQTINQIIRDEVMHNIEGFKIRAPKDSTEVEEFPAPMRHNELNITYRYSQFQARQHTFISIRMEYDIVYFAEPHHLHLYEVINYDMTTNKVIGLGDVFNVNDDYLGFLALHCRRELSERLANGMMWLPWNMKASGPFEKNFQIFMLDRQGMTITFQEYQLDPYSSEPVDIFIPYTEMRGDLSDTTPLRALAYPS